MEYIDASIFLGMHNSDETIRIAYKNYFVTRLKNNICISLEQVGKCDEIIWAYSREKQDAYYPFMDNLHTIMDIQKIGYDEEIIKEAITNPNLQNLNFSDKLTVGMILVKNGEIYSINNHLIEKENLPINLPPYGEELSFPPDLEELYQKSLALRICTKGIIPPLVTPLNELGEVCEQSVINLINFVRPYATAIMPTLSSGEGWALNDKQFEDMIKFTVKNSNSLPVFAGIECKNTNEVIQRIKLAKQFGVDAIVITTPFEENISQEEIYEHFRKIRTEVNIPIFIYNEEAISGNTINYETIIKICKLGSIIGIKEASGSVEFTQKLINSKMDVPIFQGWENLCYGSSGVEGYILPLSNLEPKLCFDMLNNPTIEKQKEIDSLCKKYNISNSDWYVFLKKELYKRGIIKTARVV